MDLWRYIFMAGEKAQAVAVAPALPAGGPAGCEARAIQQLPCLSLLYIEPLFVFTLCATLYK